MKNCKVTISDDKKMMTIEVDLTQEYGKSASGKTNIIATSSGNVCVEEDQKVYIGLNVYHKRGGF